MLRLLVLHGPNLNLLGRREQALYGTTSLDSLNKVMVRYAAKEGLHVDIRQSNIEGELVTWIQQAQGRYDGLIINPAGYTHTSVALRDAVAAVALPTVEVHLTNIHQREEFRHKSFVAGVALAQISGFGPTGYLLALQGLKQHLQSRAATKSRQPRAGLRRSRPRSARVSR